MKFLRIRNKKVVDLTWAHKMADDFTKSFGDLIGKEAKEIADETHKLLERAEAGKEDVRLTEIERPGLSHKEVIITRKGTR